MEGGGVKFEEIMIFYINDIIFFIVKIQHYFELNLQEIRLGIVKKLRRARIIEEIIIKKNKKGRARERKR